MILGACQDQWTVRRLTSTGLRFDYINRPALPRPGREASTCLLFPFPK